jgi:hypothetical protein
MPYPPGLPPERVRGGGVVTLPDKRWMPAVYQGWTHLLYPEVHLLRPNRPVITREGKLLFVNTVSDTTPAVPKRIFRLGVDGSAGDDFVGPLLGRDNYHGHAIMALSPDHRYVYVAGLGQPTVGQWGHKTFKRTWRPLHVIFRIDTRAKRDAPLPEPFIGRLGIAGRGGALLADPRGVSVDSAGNIHVADYGNNRVAVFDAKGAFLHAFNVKQPIQAEVHPRTGDLYVLCQVGKRHLKLVKLKGDARAGTSSITAEFDLPLVGRPIFPGMICLDAKADPPIIWCARGNAEIFKVLDKDGRLLNTGNPIAAQIKGGKRTRIPSGISSFELGHEGKVLFCRGTFDLNTGERLPGRRRTFYRGRDGNLYTFGRILKRFDPQGKPLPFPKARRGLKMGRSIFFATDPKGNVYIPHGGGVAKYGPGGELLNRHHVRVPLPGSSSYGAVAPLFCDAEGSLYLVSALRAPTEPMPRMFQGRLPRDTHVKPGPRLFYEHYYSSITKFGPDGGEVKLDRNGDMIIGMTYGGFKNCTVKGAKWVHLCTSPAVHRNKDHCACSCERSEPAMDGFGRLFVPDAYRYSVEVLDGSGNPLLRIGKYGAWPDAGEGEDGIALAWPVCVRVTDTHCIVNDKINHRILKLKLGHHVAKDVACPVD